jgi:hypothetical protein
MLEHNPRLVSLLNAERVALSSLKSYAAARNLPDLVTWINDGTDTRLVFKSDLENASNLAYVRNAQLSMIVQVTEEDCWIMADSAWRGPTEVAPEFSDITLTCTGGAPPYLGLFDDFLEVVNNLEHLVRMAGDRRPVSTGVIMRDCRDRRDRKIMFQHKPFLVSCRASEYLKTVLI